MDMDRRLPAYKDAEIQRSRDPAVIAAADIVVDVGGEYDPAKLRFDHHQRGFFQTFTPKHETKLSSAGLIYRHFGKEIVAGIMERPLSDPAVDLLYKRVYEDFVEGFDGIDNGVSQYPENLTPKYKETTNISARVGRLNPWWNQPDTDLFERFMKAVQLTGDEFEERVN